MTFIGCGMLDLKLIDDVKYDWCDVFEYLDLSCCGERKLSAIMSAVFYLGKSRLEEAITERIDYLEDTEKTYGISEEQKLSLTSSNGLTLTMTLKSITITSTRISLV